MHTHDHDLAPEHPRASSPVLEAEQAQAGQQSLDALQSGRADAASPDGIAHLQRTAGNAEVSRLVSDEQDPASLVQDAVGGGGQGLDPGIQRDMESHLGADLSDVKIHTGAKATESAEALGANAYTVGSDVVFREGRYDPVSHEGQHTLAHELTHVVQQRQGPVDGTPMGQGGGVSVSDPSDRFEQAAVANADQIMSQGPLGAQREEVPEEELQMSAQREEVPEEELQMSAQREEVPEEELQMSAQREDIGEEEELAL